MLTSAMQTEHRSQSLRPYREPLEPPPYLIGFMEVLIGVAGNNWAAALHIT